MYDVPGAGLLDFVAAWYVKAARYLKAADFQGENSISPAENMRGVLSNSLQVAFVSTNSIAQGEQVSVLWSWLLAQGIEIGFAHRTFKWSNEASGKAAVHCVVIGFGYEWGG